jgi:hypothetical protein
VSLIKRHPAVGWVRADLVPTESAAQEIVRLRKQVDELQAKLADIATIPPAGAENLAQGDEIFAIRFSSTLSSDEPFESDEIYSFYYSASWNAIFSAVSPSLINEASSSDIRRLLGQMPGVEEYLEEQDRIASDKGVLEINVYEDSNQIIIVQLRSLGLITRSGKPRSIKDNQTYWTLTPHGDAVMTRLRAIPHHGTGTASSPKSQ